MKISLNWLKEYVDTSNLTPEQISEKLTLSGSEVDSLHKPVNYKNIVVGEIKEIIKHPNADKLQITKTDVGKKNGGILQIVCGAPNIKVGQKIPVALVGAKFDDFEIKKAKIRDIESFGMLCSEKELGISDEHSGIMILNEKATVGQDFSTYIGADYVFDIDITPNRGDCLSVIGIARELAATLNKNVINLKFPNATVKSKKTVNVLVKEKDICPRYISKVIEGVKLGPSPKWMQERLILAGVRPINNIVDVANYVMLEWGQPLHTFDGDKINGDIIVRKAKEGEKIITLDGQERKLISKDIIICDSKKPIALAGVMGGLNSEIDDKTKTVVLEAAVFDRVMIRKTAQRLNLRSEASNRFEKGIPLNLPEIAIERAASLLTEIPGGLSGQMPVVKPKAGKNIDVLSQWLWIQHIGMRFSRLKQIIGIKISEEKVITILSSLGFEVGKFDFKKEARNQVGKPYILGASYKTYGDMAFDCSYLTDYIYSKIGKFIGYTSLAQYELGTSIKDNELLPGDILFIKGQIDKSVTDHYFIPDEKTGYKKILLKNKKEVGHNAIYIGDGRIIHAKHFEYNLKTKKWEKLKEGKVIEEDVTVFTKNPDYLGAKRYITPGVDYLAITVPWWRLDILTEEDIFEEIARIYGYDNLPSTLPSGELPIFEENNKIKISNDLKLILSGIGFSEVYNYSFVSKKQIELFDGNTDNSYIISNPTNPEQNYMRTSLAPILINNAATNQDNFDNFKIFEIAPVYKKLKNNTSEEPLFLGMIIKSNKKNNTSAFYETKGAIDILFNKINLGKAEYKEDKIEYLSEGQMAFIYINNIKVGHIGMLSDKIKHEYKIKTPMALAEIEISKLLPLYGEIIQYKEISKFPFIVRDINILFPLTVSAKTITQEFSKFQIDKLISIELVDIFEGGSLPPDKKSVTIRLTFGLKDKTLKEEEIVESLSLITKKLINKTGGEIRS